MWEPDHKEGWVLKNWCFWTVGLEKTLESPLDCKEIKSVHPKGNQPWFIGRTDTEAEAPILWPPDVKSWLIRKDPDAGKDWGQEEKGLTEDEMVGWHHQLNGHEFEQAPGVGDGQGNLVCCSLWSGKESDMTEQLNSNNHIFFPQWQHQEYERVPILHVLTNTGFFSFCIAAILTDVRWYLTVVWFSFPWWSLMESIFAYTCQPFAYLLWRNVYST